MMRYTKPVEVTPTTRYIETVKSRNQLYTLVEEANHQEYLRYLRISMTGSRFAEPTTPKITNLDQVFQSTADASQTTRRTVEFLKGTVRDNSAFIIAFINDLQNQNQNSLRVQGLQRYLKDLTRKGRIDRNTATIAWRIWQTLATSVEGNLDVPDAAAGPDGQIGFSWDEGDHHFEVEIFPSGVGELFYLNYRTDETWEAEYYFEGRLPEGISQRLALFPSHD